MDGWMIMGCFKRGLGCVGGVGWLCVAALCAGSESHVYAPHATIKNKHHPGRAFCSLYPASRLCSLGSVASPRRNVSSTRKVYLSWFCGWVGSLVGVVGLVFGAVCFVVGGVCGGGVTCYSENGGRGGVFRLVN